MSRIGKAPIPFSDKTKVEIAGSKITVTGPKGTLTHEIPADITAKVEDKNIVITRRTDMKKHRALHGLTRALVNNMVEGVTEGFKRELQIIGVGYRAEMRGKVMVLNLGYSHPIIFQPPDGITINIDGKENRVEVLGADKQMVGEVAAKIRSFYSDEHVRHKAGKTAGAGAA